MNRIWDLCKLLNNPKKLRIIGLIYLAGKSGIAVKELAVEMSEEELGKSGISQYLKQLAQLGVVRRERKGKTAVYFYDTYRARDEVEEVMELICKRLKDGGGMEFLPTFRTLMNPFRAKVAGMLKHGMAGNISDVCVKLGCSRQHALMELKLGIEDGYFGCDGGNLWLELPDDEIVKRIVELAS